MSFHKDITGRSSHTCRTVTSAYCTESVTPYQSASKQRDILNPIHNTGLHYKKQKNPPKIPNNMMVISYKHCKSVYSYKDFDVTWRRGEDKYTDFYVLSTEEIVFPKAMVYPLSARPNLIPLGGHCNQSLEHSLAKPSLLASRTLPFLSQAVIRWICSKQDYWRSEIFLSSGLARSSLKWPSSLQKQHLRTLNAEIHTYTLSKSDFSIFLTRSCMTSQHKLCVL